MKRTIADFSKVEEKKNFIYLTDWGNSRIFLIEL